MADIQREIESKFDVAPDFVLGDLGELATDGIRVETTVVDLLSTYYDTADHALLRSRLTLRRRTGAADTGWHLKVPGAGFRTELRWPLAGNDSLPRELRTLIEPFTRGAPVEPSVELQTVRTRHRLITPDDDLRVELADDEVRARGLKATVLTPRWREVEAELGPAGVARNLKESAALLTARGAFPAASTSKLERALHGQPLPTPDQNTAGSVLNDYLLAQCDALTAGHFAVSMKPYDPDSGAVPHEAVHHTRVATRRLRTALRTFGPMFDDSQASKLESELAWYATELGEVRDREVLRARLAKAVDQLPAFLVVGRVADRIDEVLLTEISQHAEALLETMRDERYWSLIMDLANWRAEPPFTAAAEMPASSLDDYVAEAEEKLAKRMKKAAAPHAEPEDLHSARKAGKRARYAAEAAAPALGKRANTLVKKATMLQTLLGEYQDSIISTEVLRRIADKVADEGGNAFTYGILVADQRRIAIDSAKAARAAAKS